MFYVFFADDTIVLLQDTRHERIVPLTNAVVCKIDIWLKQIHFTLNDGETLYMASQRKQRRIVLKNIVYLGDDFVSRARCVKF